MANNTQPVNLMQTAYNAAATITAALVGVGELAADGVLVFLEATKDVIYKDLLESHSQSGGSGTRAESRGGSGGDDLDPGTLNLRNGKYAGKTIAEVYAMDPSYVEWLANKGTNKFVAGRARLFLDRQGQTV